MGNVTAKTSGDIATFMTPAKTNIKSLKVHFSPKQDLHGYNNPWVAGGGKNLCPDLAHMTSTMPYPNISYDYNPDTYTWKITDEAGGQSTWRQARFFFDASAMAGKRVCLSYQSFTRHFGDVDSQIGRSTVSFSVGGASVWVSPEYNKKWLDIPSDVDLTNAEIGFRLAQGNGELLTKGAYIEVVGLQIEVGDTGTDFEPYENICPIDGWGGVETFGRGKNLFDKSSAVDGYISSNGKAVFNPDAQNMTSDYIPVKEGEVLTYTTYPSERGIGYWSGYAFYTEKDMNTVIGTRATKTGTTSFTITVPIGANYLRIGSRYLKDGKAQLELGLTATSYEPYQSNNISMDWSSEIGIVYGGYIDLISGELVVDKAYKVLNNPDKWIEASGTANFRYSVPFDERKIYDNSYSGLTCSYVPCLYGAEPYGRWNAALGTYFSIKSSTLTLEQVKADASAGNIAIAYELATPITHQLTPTQLQSFVGQNNFWSNADYVEVEYDLIETIDIQKCRKKIILNQPHIESQVGSKSSTQVTHFKTDMKASLKECKVYFTPIQTGSGDPSPTNIRPITGWTSITLNHTGVNMLECDSPDYFINNAGTNDGVASTLTRNTDGQIESVTFNGTSTSTNIFRNLNYTPASSSEVTMPSGQIALTSYSSQIYLTPMGNSDIPRTINGKVWHQSYVDTLNNWAIWNVGTSDGYNGLWIRAQMFPQQSGLNIDTTIYPMMCLMEDQGCEFEVYKGNKYNIDWTSDAGTVYGGYLDLISGELVVDRAMVDLGTLNWTWNATNGWIASISGLKPMANNNVPMSAIASNMPVVSKTQSESIVQSGTNEDTIAATWQGTYLYGTNANASPIGQLCYKLATPITYQLTPQQLLSFKGINNIWANTNGQTEVKYWTYKSIPQEEINYLNYAVWSEAGYIGANGKETIQATSASHFFKTPILLKAGTYNLNGFSNYVGSDNTRYRIHEYNQNGSWVKQITYQQIGNLSPVDISFTLDKDTYVKLSIAIAFEGTLTKVN